MPTLQPGIRRRWLGQRMNADSRIAWGAQFLSDAARIDILSRVDPLGAAAALRDQQLEQRESDPFYATAESVFDAASKARFSHNTSLFATERAKLVAAVRQAVEGGAMVTWTTNIASMGRRQRRTRCAIRITVSMDDKSQFDFVNRMDIATHDAVDAALREGVNGVSAYSGGGW